MVRTSGYGGRRIKKTARIQTNGKNRPEITLTISGSVEKFVTINPRAIRLFGSPEEQIKATVNITPEKKYPFKISNITALKGENIAYKMEEVKNGEKSGYLLTVENLKKDKGRYYDMINLKTDSLLRPEIKISVYAYIFNKNNTIE